MEQMTDQELWDLELMGEITNILTQQDEESYSLLRYIGKVCGIDEQIRLTKWMEEGCPDNYDQL